MKKKVILKALLLVFPILAVGLATTVNSVTVFDTVTGETQYFSYFDVLPIANLQMLGFAIQELALYLDTHRDDREALAQYRAYQQMYRKLSEAHAMTLNHMSPGKGDDYNWLDDPWPWEYAANKEV